MVFDSVTSFGEGVEDLPLNFFPLDGVGHDSAAAVLRDGRLLAAAAEERFNRFKHSTAAGGRVLPPGKAVEYCLAEAGRADDLEHVAFYCDFTPAALQDRIRAVEPHLSAKVKDRVLAAYHAVYDGTVSNERIADEIAEVLGERRRQPHIHFVPHHLAHAASAFYSSGYREAGVLTVDGFGERSSSIFAVGTADGLKQMEETILPGSLGVLYMMMTAYLGFKPLDGEYKVMGLASYGNPKTYAKQFEGLLDRADDGTCRTTALLRDDFGDHIKSLFGPARAYTDAVTQREMDIASALQAQLEDAMFCRLEYLKRKYGIERICLAGGVALNVRDDRKTRALRDVQADLCVSRVGRRRGERRRGTVRAPSGARPWPGGAPVPSMSLGPAYAKDGVIRALEGYANKIDYRRVDRIEEAVADALAAGKIVGWFSGRMEFGPRALGNRSILADPRAGEMREVVNQRVKLREEFRPFAPAALVETPTTFRHARRRPVGFMEFVVPATPLGRDKTKAVVHFDGSARIQTVDRDSNEPFWKVIEAFGRRTGVPVVLNTSFNVRGELIVCTPQDAIRCFLSTDIDLLALENFVVNKKAGRVLAEDMAQPAIDD